MAVIRINKDHNYTVMSNYHFKEKEMSLKAKGLLSLMLSLPDTWDYSIAGLVAICKENESAIKSTLNELKTFGYLVMTKKMPNETKSGRIEYDYDIYEKPQQQEVEKQGIENLGVEVQGVENQGQLNTNELSTKKKIINSTAEAEPTTTIVKQIIDYMNNCGVLENFKIKKAFNFSAKAQGNLKYILPRIKEGNTLDDFKDVIYHTYDKFVENEFKGLNGKSSIQYYRPSTLFSSENMEKYKNEYKNL